MKARSPKSEKNGLNWQKTNSVSYSSFRISHLCAAATSINNALEVCGSTCAITCGISKFKHRFGFQDTSTIDALLDKEEVSLDAILDEDDLLQECKSQNTRLMDYFQRIDVLQRLFGYVSGNIEGEGLGKVKCVLRMVLISARR